MASPNLYSSNGTRRRRHSVTVCETPQSQINGKTEAQNDLNSIQKKLAYKYDYSSGSNSSSGTVTPTGPGKSDDAGATGYVINTPEMFANLQSELLRSVRC